MTPLDLLLSRLPGARKSGSGWMARCPAHDDRHASLSVSTGDDGRVLLHCHTGCDPSAIMEALGLSLADLFPARDGAMPSRNGKSTSGGQTFVTAHDAVAALERRHGPRSAIWTYRDAAGHPVGLMVRWDTPGGGKEIRPVARRADGWQIGAMPEPRPLYRLPDLLTRREELVYVVEGEKCADALAKLGLLATTSPHGSQSAGKADWSPLAGRRVIILPDHDAAGERYALEVARLAHAVGAADVRLLRLAEHAPELPAGGDVADVLASPNWCGIGLGDAAMPEDFVNLLCRLAEVAPEAVPDWTSANPKPPGPDLVCLADVEPRKISWLWPGRVPLGRITLLVGRPGEGKSFLATDMAARITTGSPWPDGSDCPAGSVILISAEDDPGDTIRPRLDAHCADVRKVHLLSAVRRSGEGGQTYEVPFTLADVESLETALETLPDCRLIVVDPIGSFLGGDTDAYRDNEVRGVLAPVARLAEKYGPAVLMVAHRRKSAGSIADDLALGSRAFTGIARAVWHLSRDADNKNRRLLLPGKNNLAPEGNGLAFAIIGEPPRLVWEHQPVEMTADEALLAETENQRRSEDRRRLIEWLKARGGEATPREVQQGCRWLRGPGAAEAALEGLVQGGHGSWRDVPTTERGGRPARTFALSTKP